MASMVRAAKSSSRPEPYRRPSKGGADASGAWKHDLHAGAGTGTGTGTGSLASRLSGASAGGGGGSVQGASLLARISGAKGKELLPSHGSANKLHGFGAAAPTAPSGTTPRNARVELLPNANRRAGRGPKAPPASKGRLVDSGINAALGIQIPRTREIRAPPVLAPPVQSVSIVGAARKSTWVRIDNLAQGTTTDDVLSAFAPAPIVDARIASSTLSTVSIELELETRDAAEDVVARYNGAAADGNTLVVAIIRVGLADRMGRGQQPVQQQTAPRGYSPANGTGKMYSDSILATDPSSSIITLAQDEEGREVRASAWPRQPTLSQRLGVRR